MSAAEEKPEVEEQEDDNSYYDDVRADIDTAIYAFSALQEVDMVLYSKAMQQNISSAKRNCVFIICKGMKLLREGYEESEDDE
jgi:hypothetical protein